MNFRSRTLRATAHAFATHTKMALTSAALLSCVAATAHAQGPATIVAPTAVGSSTSGQVTFTVSGTLAALVGTTQGTAGLDFTAGGGTCQSGSCTFSFTFSPKAPGIRSGAIVAKNAAGATIGYGLVSGVGLQGNGVTYPAAQSALITGQYTIYSIFVDAAGNVYTADDNSQSYFKFTKSGSTYTRSLIGKTTGQPDGIWLDGAGNVYAADFSDSSGFGTVTKFPYSNGAYGTGTVVLSLPSGGQAANVSLDAAGNMYVANYGTTFYKGALQSNGTYTLSTLYTNSAFTNTTCIIPDAAGNFYIVATDTSVPANSTVGILKPSGATYAFTKIPATLINPGVVAIDAGGNIYVADLGTYDSSKAAQAGAAVYLFTPTAGGTYTQTAISGTVNSANAVFVDPNGKVYWGDQPGNVSSTNTTASTVYQIDPTATPTFAFGNTTVTQSSATQTAKLVNTGSSALTFTTPASGGKNPSIANGFTISNSSTCPQLTNSSSTQTLAAGTFCTDVVSFSPIVGGSQSGQLVTTDNSFTATTQTVTLTGTGTTGSSPQSITFTQPATPVYYPATTSEALTASSSSGLPITFTVTSGPGTISGSSVVFSGAGYVVVTASQAGNGTYAAATSVQRTIQVVVADTTATTLTLARTSATVGDAAFNLTATVADTTNTGNFPGGSVTFTDTLGTTTTTIGTANISPNGTGLSAIQSYTPSTAGSHTITATYNPSSVTYASSSTTKPLTISQAAVGTVGYQFTVAPGSSVTLTFNATYPGSVPPSGAVTIKVNGSTANLSGQTCVYKAKHSNCSVTYAAPAALAVGDYPITFSQAADANYNATSGTGILHVTSTGTAAPGLPVKAAAAAAVSATAPVRGGVVAIPSLLPDSLEVNTTSDDAKPDTAAKPEDADSTGDKKKLAQQQ